MGRENVLEETLENPKSRLWALAYRMLGNPADADDALQETWLRLNRPDQGEIANPEAWLTTVVSRICLNGLRSRKSHGQFAQLSDDFQGHDDDLHIRDSSFPAPEEESLLSDAIGTALMMIVETLSPPERLAFILHDVFGIPFEEIALILDRTPTSARQLASRARRRVQFNDHETIQAIEVRKKEKREVVEAFLLASKNGEFQKLVTMLDPSVTLRADEVAAKIGAPSNKNGAKEVAEVFSGNARAARVKEIDGRPGLVWSQGSEIKMIFDFFFLEDKILSVRMIADPNRIKLFDIQ